MVRGYILGALRVLFFLAFPLGAWAGPQYLTYEGYIETNDAVPVPITTLVNMKFQIRSSTSCILYEETHPVTPDLGHFSVKVGTGTMTFTPPSFTNISALFSNLSTLSGLLDNSSACSYPPNVNDPRILLVKIEDTPSNFVTIANFNLGSTVSAFNADNANQVGGYKSANLLRATDDFGVPVDVSPFLPAKMSELLKLLDGSSSSFMKPSSAITFSNTITFGTAPQFSGTPSGGSDLTNKTYVDNAVAGALPNVGTAGTYYKVFTDAKGRVTSGTASLVAADIPSLDATKITSGTFAQSQIPVLSIAGAVSGNAITSGTISGNSAVNTTGNIYSTGTVTGGTVSATTLQIYNGLNFVAITANTMSGNLNWVLPFNAGSSGQVLRTDGAGNLSWVSASAGSVSSLATGTGLSGGPITSSGTISLANTSVAAGSYGTSTSIPTFDVDAQGRLTGVTAQAIPTAGTSTSGLLLSSDWNVFSGKVNKAGDTMTGSLTLPANPSANLEASTKQYVDAVTIASDAAFIRKDGTLAFTAAQSMGSNKLTFVADPTGAQDAATKNYADTKLLSRTATAPAVGQNGQSLRWNESNTTWEYFSAGSGSVGYIDTGTGLSGGPITTSGTISLAATTVVAGSYGTATSVPALTVDAQGRLTAVSNIAIPTSNTTTTGLLNSTDWSSFNSKLGTASTFAGDVSGVYTATSVDKIKSTPVTIVSTLTSGNFLKYNGSAWVNSNLELGDVTTGLGYTPVNKAGSSMSGLLFLSADPNDNLGAVSKQYADKKLLSRNAPAPTLALSGQALRWNDAISFWEYYLPAVGSVTSVTGTAPITVTNSSSTPSISLNNTTVVAGSYGTAVSIPNFNVDAQGRITGAVDKNIALPTSQITRSGAAANNVLKWNDLNLLWSPENILSADVTGALGYTPVRKAGDTMGGALISDLGTAAFPSVGVGGTSLGLFYGGPNVLGFSTAGTERMRVDGTGNVGVGTRFPTGQLEVLETDTHELRGIVTSQIGTGSGAARITFKRAAGTPDALAAIGAGVNLGSMAAYGYDGTDYGTNSSAAINFTSTEAFTTTKKGSLISFYTTASGTVATAERMRINHNGNVGIGTNNPAVLLDVGNTSVSNTVANFSNTGGAPTAKFINSGTGAGPAAIFHSHSGPPALFLTGTTPTEKMRVDSNGNVGIGTAIPNATLEVNGTVKIGSGGAPMSNFTVCTKDSITTSAGAAMTISGPGCGSVTASSACTCQANSPITTAISYVVPASSSLTIYFTANTSIAADTKLVCMCVN